MVSQSDADTSRSYDWSYSSSSKARVQIVGRVSGTAQRWTVEQKLAIIGLKLSRRGSSTVASTIERHEISILQLYTWRRQIA